MKNILLLALILSFSTQAFAKGIFGSVTNRKTKQKLTTHLEGHTLTFEIESKSGEKRVYRSLELDYINHIGELHNRTNAPRLIKWSDLGLEMTGDYLDFMSDSEVVEAFVNGLRGTGEIFGNLWDKMDDIHYYCTSSWGSNARKLICYLPIPGYPIAMVVTAAGYTVVGAGAFTLNMIFGGFSAIGYAITPLVFTVEILKNVGILSVQGVKSIFSRKIRSARKLKKIMKGKNVKVSNKMFGEILNRIDSIY